MSIPVLVNGAAGRMGSITVNYLSAQPDITVVGTCEHTDDLAQEIHHSNASVVVDFTVPTAVFDNAQTIIEAGAHPVIGTSGLTDEQVTVLAQLCEEKKRGAILAANFSIGALCMMRYAQEAAAFFPDVEIIEMHHPHKVDAPSGTATRTAHMIQEARGQSKNINQNQDPARGARTHDVPIHSIRMSGAFAHQSVIFGDAGETLTIRHDGMTRDCCMPGVAWCCRAVQQLQTLRTFESLFFEKSRPLNHCPVS